MQTSVPFTSGTDGYPTYRIPALVRTGAGTLLAFAEGRTSTSDTGAIDIVLRRSLDGGVTWQPLQAVAKGGTATRGNPAAVALPSGRVVLVSSYNDGGVTETQIMQGKAAARRVFVQHSDDEGATWSSPAEITSQVRRSTWRWYATGPGAGIVTRSGRMAIPANHSLAPASGSGDLGSEAKYYGAHAILSDDDGATWRIGFVCSNPNGGVNENESNGCELPDGRLYFSCRNQGGSSPGTRADAYSADGGQSLVMDYRPQATLTTPVVQGSVIAVGDALLYSGPTGPDRAAMALWVSTDQGVTWELRRHVSGLPAAYSSLALLDDSTVGLLYETGDWSLYRRIEHVRIALADLGL
ncbi:exo-alpha-sialidase [Streptomyces sp. TS71-3]|uniref:sialidase family protein n=1 Tax=Streptomyces sp. TS71-3 TaxID=2733862 RepID=UPI001B0E1C2B|nr:sialidase family protein [Streptomyces sp. TS71-3]GHJ37500.1 hypothetical protein Sm713_31090 [Streptomyces sp. TS71-3]